MSHHFLTNHNYSVQPKSSSSPSKIINTIKSTTTPTTNKRKHSCYYPTTTTMASAKIGPTQSPLLANQPKDTINLAVGHPMHSELPNKIISFPLLSRCESSLPLRRRRPRRRQRRRREKTFFFKTLLRAHDCSLRRRRRRPSTLARARERGKSVVWGRAHIF